MTVAETPVAPGRPLLTRKLRLRELIVLDVLATVALVALCAYAAADAPAAAGTIRETVPADNWWTSAAVGVVVAAPLAVRRRWPLGVLAAVFVLSQAALLLGVIPSYAAAAPYAVVSFALYLVAATVPRGRSVPALAVCLAGAAVTAGVALPAPADGVAGVAFAWLMLGASWIVGRAARERRAYAARTARQLARQAVTDERLRVARELHDIVAHSMSLIAVKAAVANHVAEVRPEEARAALGIIELTSRGALADMRQTVEALRADGGPRRPLPGLGDLPDLVRSVATGRVTLDVRVSPGAQVPDGVGLSAYRIVQEALTNVVRHAGPAHCRVAVAVVGGEVSVAVLDDGRGAASGANPAGHGLIGMRERVSLHGGSFAAGPRPEGGFAVTARLPYDRPGATR